jgi:hypothetical protein
MIPKALRKWLRISAYKVLMKHEVKSYYFIRICWNVGSFHKIVINYAVPIPHKKDTAYW